MVIQHLAKVILMKQLLIKDNQYKSKSYFSEIKDVVDCIADKTLAELEKEGVFVFPSSVRESEDLTNDQMILQSYNDMYVSGNVMGFLGVENQRLVIESRFSRGERDYFFQFWLLHLGYQPTNRLQLKLKILVMEKCLKKFLNFLIL